MRADDYLTSTRRGHGHSVAKGACRFHCSENVEEQAWQARIVDATAYDGLFWPVARKLRVF
jgi:hypothetical protein